MNREKLVAFALGFAAGVLLMLLVGGGVGGLAGWVLYQQAEAHRERAAAAEQKAKELQRLQEESDRAVEEALQNEAAARRRAQADFERANEALLEMQRHLLEKP
jgi:hypothetical protein